MIVRYLAGLVLFIVVALVYSSTKRRDPREAARGSVVMLFYLMVAVTALGGLAYLVSHFK